ncbi:MAG TPA: iron-sulfur cluster biosynthesis protein [Actinomycetota bacterium]|nr:iron-sulfur cluster biosynthesis protein [Actinomycetota bacterium]
MLQVTEAAVGVIRQIRIATPGVSDEAKARIQLVASGEEEQPGLGFGFSDDPIEGDQPVVEQEDIQVFLAPELVEPLAAAVVDAVPGEEGQQLVLREQEGEPEDGES